MKCLIALNRKYEFLFAFFCSLYYLREEKKGPKKCPPTEKGLMINEKLMVSQIAPKASERQ